MQEGGAEAAVAGRCQVQAHAADAREHVSTCTPALGHCMPASAGTMVG